MTRNLPSVEFLALTPKPHGGVHGKNEYRRHAITKRLVGKKGSLHIFEAECPECGWSFFQMRGQHRKKLSKCKECGFTSFTTSGFWPLGTERCPPIEPPSRDDFREEPWTAVVQYKDLEPKRVIGTREWVEDKTEGDFYDVVEPPAVWRTE